MGTFNNFGEYHCLAIRENNNKTGEGIAINMERIVKDTGIGNEIVNKIRSHAPIITDCAKSQKKGNKIFLKSISSNIGRGNIFTQLFLIAFFCKKNRIFKTIFCTIYCLQF